MKYKHEEEVIIAKSWCFSNKRETFYRYEYNNKCTRLKSHHKNYRSIKHLSKYCISMVLILRIAYQVD